MIALVALAPWTSASPLDEKPAKTGSLAVVEVDARGEIELLDSAGTRSRPKSGRIELWSRYYLSWHRQVIPVEDGRWSARVPTPVAWAVVGRVVLDGREAYVAHGGWDGEPPSDSRWTAKLVAPVQLTVVDAGSSARLADFEVREWDAGTPPIAANDGWIVTTKSSGSFALPAWSLDPDPEPLTGFAWTAKRSFWVRAPERAWVRVEPDFAKGGEVVARLVRSGGVRARMSAATRRELLRGSSPCLEVDFGGAVVRQRVDVNRDVVDCELDGLTPGPLTLRWILAGQAPPIVLARTTVRIEPGSIAVIEL